MKPPKINLLKQKPIRDRRKGNIMHENIIYRYSFIMPAYNSIKTIGESLEAIFKQIDNTMEVIVFDDGSTDGTVEAVKRYPCRIIQENVNSGPAFGRNKGAEFAKGEILVFVDSDVIIPPDTIKFLDSMFYEKDADATIGVYSPKLRFDNFASNYKNIYQYYTYGFFPELKNIPNFCSSLAAIKKSVFMDLHGYDARYQTAYIEDTEFGERIAAKYKLYSCRQLEFEHIKHYTVFQVLKTDYRRAGSTMKLMLRRLFIGSDSYYAKPSQKAYTSLQKSYIYGIMLKGLALLFLLSGALIHPIGYLMALFAYSIIIIINYKFIELVMTRFNHKKRFFIFIKTCLFLFLDLFSMGLGIFTSMVMFPFGKKY